MADLQILIADDHKIIRDGLQAMLEDAEGINVVAEATGGEEVLEICRSEKIDIAIMDINMPEPNGIETTRMLKKEFPNINVLALTMMQEDEHIRRMIAAGAGGYISKSSGSEELIEAIHTVAKGENYFSEEATKAVMKNLVESGGKKKKSVSSGDLTERELEVLKLICRELTNKEIAEKLYISIRTVDAHRRNLLQKTGARNTAGLVKYAVRNNLV